MSTDKTGSLRRIVRTQRLLAELGHADVLEALEELRQLRTSLSQPLGAGQVQGASPSGTALSAPAADAASAPIAGAACTHPCGDSACREQCKNDPSGLCIGGERCSCPPGSVLRMNCALWTRDVWNWANELKPADLREVLCHRWDGGRLVGWWNGVAWFCCAGLVPEGAIACWRELPDPPPAAVIQSRITEQANAPEAKW